MGGLTLLSLVWGINLSLKLMSINICDARSFPNIVPNEFVTELGIEIENWTVSGSAILGSLKSMLPTSNSIETMGKFVLPVS